MKLFKKELLLLFLSLLFASILCEGLYRAYEFHFYRRQLRKFEKSLEILRLAPKNPVLQYLLKPEGTFLLAGKIPYKINKSGFRDVDFPVDKGSAQRIMVLGDSNTFGWGVTMEDTFPKVLERQLRGKGLDVQVINAGVYGYNTRQEVLFLKDELLRYKPDLVIMAFHPNDTQVNGVSPNHPFIKNGESHYHSWLLEFLKSRINRQINKGKRDASWCTEKSGDFFPIKVRLANFCISYEQGFADDYPGWIRCKESLLEAQRISKAEGFAFVLALLPDFASDFADYDLAWVHEKVRKFAEGSGINTIDLYRYFAGMDHASLQNTELQDTHPNSRAHAIIAASLSSELQERGLLK